jgi:hypothetical protein
MEVLIITGPSGKDKYKINPFYQNDLLDDLMQSWKSLSITSSFWTNIVQVFGNMGHKKQE